MTFNQLRLNAIRAAQNLQKLHGFCSHQKFCFMTFQNENLLSIVLASIGLACPLVPLYPKILSSHEIVRILMQVKPLIVFCDANLYGQLNDVLQKLPFTPKVYLLDDVQSDDGVESVMNLFRPTDDEHSFMCVFSA